LLRSSNVLAAEWPLLFLTSLLVLFYLLNAVLLSLSFAHGSHNIVAANYVAQTAATIASVAFVHALGVTGALLLYLSCQAASCLVLGRHGRFKTAIAMLREAFTSTSAQVEAFGQLAVAAVSPRLIVILLSLISVFVAGFTEKPEKIAVLRVGLTILNLLQYANPISPPVLQKAVSEGLDGRLILGGLGAFLIVGGISGITTAALQQPLFALFFGMPLSHSSGFSLMMAALPFYVLAGPVSAVLIALGLERINLVALLLACATFLASEMAGDVFLAVFLSSVVFTTIGAAAIAMNAAKTIPDRVD
jgi:hypothetical protein